MATTIGPREAASLQAQPLPNPYGIGPGEVHASTLDLAIPVEPGSTSRGSIPKASARAALPPGVQHEIYREADARFWAQTKYRPGHSLDPSSPADRHWLPVYYRIGNQVESEWRSGALKDPNAPGWTYKHPVVQAAISDAADAHVETTRALADAQAAERARDDQAARAALERANAAHAALEHATAVAASVQPPSVHPQHVREAAHRVLHFHMNAAGVGVLDPADAAAAMQASSATATPDLPSGNGNEASSALDQSNPEGRGAATVWHAAPTPIKAIAVVAGVLGLGVLVAKTVGESRPAF